jgi:hypothetical protein
MQMNPRAFNLSVKPTMAAEIPGWLQDQAARTIVQIRQAIWRIEHKLQDTDTQDAEKDFRIVGRALRDLRQDVKYTEEFASGQVQRRNGGTR